MSTQYTKKSINILGVTGSIGQSARDVILAQSECFDVRVISAHSRVEELAEMALELNASVAVITEEAHLPALEAALDGHGVTCLGGAEVLAEAQSFEVDMTLAAIVGIAGLRPVLKAIEHSGAVAIANKEPLVAAGDLVMAAACEHDTKILPVDSEHNAVFQVFDFDNKKAIERIILTASGGPFRTWSPEEIQGATREQALNHPNWEMGAKISIDSATMMNKALEIIEAAYLFDLPADKIDVLIHPQSVVHSMVEYCDGSVLAQMGASDMRTPLANVLGYPERLNTPGARLSLTKLASLGFEEPDLKQFPALGLAYKCLEKGQASCVALNAANEETVSHFLTNEMAFADIIDIVIEVLDRAEDKTHSVSLSTVDEIEKYDTTIRSLTRDVIEVRSEIVNSSANIKINNGA